jgi:CRISPR/Cas system CSM-associated protein Csm3 (group 7 of RAMP superfamily)
MKKERIHLTYQLHFDSAFHFGTGLRGGLVHRLVARNADDYLLVPGSTLKGVVRERCEQLAKLFDIRTTRPHTDDWAEVKASRPDIVAQVFGTRFVPGKLYFDDAQLIDEQQAWFELPAGWRPFQRHKFRKWQTEQRTQVSLSRVTHTAQPGRLYTSEYGRANLTFTGTIRGLVAGTELFDNDSWGTYPLLLLITGLLSLERIGGSKSSGAGELTVTIGKLEVDGTERQVADLLSDLPSFDLYLEWREEVLE